MLALHEVRFEHQIYKCILKREIAVASLDSSAALRFFHLVEARARRCSGCDEWKETHPLCWGWYYECCCYYCYPCCHSCYSYYLLYMIFYFCCICYIYYHHYCYYYYVYHGTSYPESLLF